MINCTTNQVSLSDSNDQSTRQVPGHESQTDKLLSHLWRGGEWAYWWTPDGPDYFSEKYQGIRKAKVSLWFPLNRERPTIPAAWQDRNVYFGVHPAISAGRHWQRAKIGTVAAVNAVFAEFDVEDYGSKAAIWSRLETLPLFPTCVIDSGGGLHCYWLIERPQIVTDDNRTYLKLLQAAWVELAGGDDGAKDLARVLRLPGLQNRKAERGPDFPKVQIIEFNPKRLFPFSQIQSLVDGRIKHASMINQQRREEDAVRSVEVASGAAEQLLDWAVRNAHTGSRHSMALWLAGRLKAEKIAPWVANSVLKEFARRVNTAGTRQLETDEMEKVTGYIWGKS